MKEEDKKEGLLKRLKNIEGNSEKQLKSIKDQGEIQTKIISKNKIKPPLLKSIYGQEVKGRKINSDGAKKYSEFLGICRVVNFDFDFARFGPVCSFYLRMMNGCIGVKVAKLSMKEFEYQIDRLVRKIAKKPT